MKWESHWMNLVGNNQKLLLYQNELKEKSNDKQNKKNMKLLSRWKGGVIWERQTGTNTNERASVCACVGGGG